MLTKSDLIAIKQIVSQIFQHELKYQLTPIIKDIRELRDDLHVIVISYDAKFKHLEKRTDRIEKELDLPPFE